MIIAWKQLPAQVSLVLPVAPIVFFICIGLLIGLIPIGPFYENFMTCTHMRVIWCHMYLFCVGDLRRGFLLCFAGKRRYSCRNINMIKKNYVAVIPRTILFHFTGERQFIFFKVFSNAVLVHVQTLCITSNLMGNSLWCCATVVKIPWKSVWPLQRRHKVHIPYTCFMSYMKSSGITLDWKILFYPSGISLIIDFFSFHWRKFKDWFITLTRVTKVTVFIE